MGLSNQTLAPSVSPLSETDLPRILAKFSFPWSTPEKTQTLWSRYYEEQQKGLRTVAVLKQGDEILGYASLLRQSQHPPFAQKNIPEIHDLWIDRDHRKGGLGTALIRWLEKLAREEGYLEIGMGVGLYSDYGAAQKLYARLDYVPDGSGVTYQGKPTVAGQSYPLDDDLILWLSKNNASLHFSPAQSSQRALLHRWFEQPHILAWMHGAGLQSTLDGLEKFFQGGSSATYWIGYHRDTPFAFLITAPHEPEALCLDVFICDLAYVGKGLAAPIIRQFLLSHFSHVKKILIDPEKSNTRAIHVYQKVGFKITGEFIASWHPVPHYQMELSMHELLQLPP